MVVVVVGTGGGATGIGLVVTFLSGRILDVLGCSCFQIREFGPFFTEGLLQHNSEL